MIIWQCESCKYVWNGDETDFECPCCEDTNLKEVDRDV